MPRKPRSTSKTTPDTPPAAPARVAAAGTVTLSAEAQALFDSVSREWSLTSPVRQLLLLACTAITKAGECEAITAVEGMTVADQKGSSKPHPAALLARDYRAQASGTLQRILSNLQE
ncbi:MAG: hypothetical protein LW698_10375 [Planctomycetaceae bacterium]|jgi:hypothetical protein|nr:hypothetical protein [Planctomycetaceae bacterium]